MLYRQVDESIIKDTKRYKYGKAQELVLSFSKSEIPVAELEWKGTYKNPHSATTTFHRSLAPLQMPHIKMMQRGDHVYIVNTLLLSK